MILLKLLFFIFAVPAIIWELNCLFDSEKVQKFKAAFSKAAKNKEKMEGTYLTYSFSQLLYWIWCIVGLFSSQWIMFILFIVFGFVVRGKSTFMIQVNAIGSILILVFTVINAFHLHINLLEFVLTFVR